MFSWHFQSTMHGESGLTTGLLSDTHIQCLVLKLFCRKLTTCLEGYLWMYAHVVLLYDVIMRWVSLRQLCFVMENVIGRPWHDKAKILWHQSYLSPLASVQRRVCKTEVSDDRIIINIIVHFLIISKLKQCSGSLNGASTVTQWFLLTRRKTRINAWKW